MMKYLSMFIMALFVLNLSLIDSAEAQRRNRHPRYDRNPAPHRPGPGYPSPGRVSCSASDRGWEEHWSGHSSCGACLQHHGDCVETCKETTQLCEVEGQDYRGGIAIFRAVGVDRWSAESEARRRCEWNRNMRYCRTIRCISQDRTISTRRCR